MLMSLMLILMIIQSATDDDTDIEDDEEEAEPPKKRRIGNPDDSGVSKEEDSISFYIDQFKCLNPVICLTLFGSFALHDG